MRKFFGFTFFGSLGIDITLNFSSFMEGFYNGFYLMQTPFETIASFLGNSFFLVVKFLSN